ncbi:MAG: aminopeptidase P N-terminal domain-containing protein [Candidatus Saccharimonadales bacterium]
MDKSLTKAFFEGNRAKLLKASGSNLLIVTANGLLQKSSDEAFPFVQDPSFWYLTGINEPDLILVKTNDEEFIVIPKYYVRRQSVIKELDTDNIVKVSGIKHIYDHKLGWQKIEQLLRINQEYATITPNPVLLKFHGIYTNPARRHLTSTIKRLKPEIKVHDLKKQLAILRMQKQPVEIKLIKRAVDITTETLKEVLNESNLMKYKDTSQIEQDILAGFKSRGAAGHAFEPVVASGANTALIHSDSLAQPLKPGELIVCDVGSMYSFYKADITRTVIYGQPTARQQQVYEAVRFVQSEAYKMIKPNMVYIDYERRVTELIGEQLIKLGLIKNPSKKTISKYYMTYCSHSLGLDTHDSADYSQKLPSNMVMVVEPGIYIKEEGIGVRIEDVVQITNDGYKILSSSLPIGLKI